MADGWIVALIAGALALVIALAWWLDASHHRVASGDLLEAWRTVDQVKREHAEDLRTLAETHAQLTEERARADRYAHVIDALTRRPPASAHPIALAPELLDQLTTERAGS